MDWGQESMALAITALLATSIRLLVATDIKLLMAMAVRILMAMATRILMAMANTLRERTSSSELRQSRTAAAAANPGGQRKCPEHVKGRRPARKEASAPISSAIKNRSQQWNAWIRFRFRFRSGKFYRFFVIF